MGKEGEWSIESLPAYQSRNAEEIDWLWNASLPPNRDTNPAVWDSIIGFFEDAIVAACGRPGHLVVTPRELLKQLKYNGREPASAMKVIDELFQRGDIVRADTLKTSANGKGSRMTAPSSTFGSIRSTISSYIWGPSKPATPSLDDAIVPTSSLKAAATRAQTLEGVTASAEIHTVKTFAQSVTCGNTRDAEAVIGYMVSQGSANALLTDVTKDQPEPVLGVKVGSAVNESDKGVLRTKAALERMEGMAAHLQKSVDTEDENARLAVKRGDKADALNKLKNKKLLQAKLTSARSAASKLKDVLMAVDEAESNREAVSALETGMQSLKVATKDGVTADRIDAVAADFDEAMAEQQDVRSAFETLNMDASGADAELEEELAQMMAGEKEQQEKEQKPIQEEQESASSKLVEEAEAELAKLLAELPMPNSPDRVGAAMASHKAAEEQQNSQTEEDAPTAAGPAS